MHIGNSHEHIVDQETNELEEIAIIGLACRFPGAKNKIEFWQNLINGRCSIKTFTREECLASGIPEELIDDPNYVRKLGVLDNPDLFAADFFNYSPKEAERIDPQQRIFLECAWEAMEDAGYIPDSYNGSVGVFAGSGLNYYLLKNLLNTSPHLEDVINVLTFIGNEKDFLSTRVSYKFNLTGPSYSVQTACSTSLVAVHLACQSLLSYQCDLALCGGVSLQTPRMYGYMYTDGEIFSPDGNIRAFDKDANGMLFGEGAGVVILKRLSEAVKDRDYIYAVIKSTAINNDGAQKVGFTAPSITGQAEVIQLAQNLADISADSISFIEAHGTGTQMGDPIEVAALTQVFRETSSKKNYCALGSVKANIGHLDVAAGIAGLIKTVLCLQNKKIPPQINFQTPNPELNLGESPFYVNTALTDWSESRDWPRRAGVSSFGMGGTNAHLILEEAPKYNEKSSSLPYFIFNFSAKKKESLINTINNFTSFLSVNKDISLADAAYTLSTGRKEFPYRYSIACNSIHDILNESIENIQASIPDTKPFTAKNIVFLFPGQGSQYPKMSYDLYHNDIFFKSLVDSCALIIQKKAGFDILKIIFTSDSSKDILNQTLYSQLALFTIEYSLAHYLIELGINPYAMIGHSLGEISAASIAGVFSLEDAISFIIARGKILQKAPSGAMLAAALSEEEANKYVNEKIFISAVNSNNQSVFSGECGAVMELEKTLNASGIATNLLKTGNPFHTPLLKGVAPELLSALKGITFHEPQIKLISNITGDWGKSQEITSPEYWEHHALETIRFKSGSEKLLDLPNSFFIEIGPGNVLSSLIKTSSLFTDNHRIISTLPHEKQKISDMLFFFKSIGKIWEFGISVDWKKFYKNEKRNHIPLPATVLEQQSYWLVPSIRKIDKITGEETIAHIAVQYQESIIQKKEFPTGIEERVMAIWKDILGYKIININDNFFDLGGNSLIAAQIISRINKTLSINIPVSLIFDLPTIQELSRYLITNINILAMKKHTPITVRKIDSPLPLSFAQKRLWFFHEYDSINPAYNLAQSMQIKGTIDVDILKKSLEFLVNRHEAFRTNFKNFGGEPQVIINNAVDVNIYLIDFSYLSLNERENTIKNHILQTVQKPYDFEKDTLYKIIIYTISPEFYLMVLYIPHIISDGWSFTIFQRELENVYFNLMDNKKIQLEPLSIQYVDYAAWQENQYKNRDFTAQIEFWRNYLGTSLPVLQLPYDFSRPANLNNQGSTAHFHLADKELFTAIQEIGIKYNVTNFIVMLAALNILFYKYSGQETIVIGTPYANRDHEQIENIIGFFLNMLPIRTDFSQERSFSGLLKMLMSDFFQTVTNNEIHFEQLVEILEVERHQNIHPVFQVMVAYQNYLTFSSTDREVQFKQIFSNRGISEYDISFYIWEENQNIVGAVEYSTELFKESTILRMLKHLKIILESTVKNPDISINQISIITQEERDQILNVWNSTYKDYTSISVLPDIFYQVSDIHKNKSAARCGQKEITYQMLNHESNQMARYLVNKGVKPGTLVGILLERNLKMLISILGVLKAGAAYIPLDPNFPVSRLELMVQDSKLPFIITESNLLNLIKTDNYVEKIVVDYDWGKIEKEDIQNLNLKIDKESLAYILYTSGSTGIPNGVQIQHKALINFLLSMREIPGINADDTMLALTTLSFDIAGLELLLPLITGATIEIIAHEQASDGLELKKIIQEKNITIMQATPATYQILFESGWDKAVGLKVLCGGEAMSRELAGRLIDTGAQVWNMYGPTETTIWSSIFSLSIENQKPLLGKPIANTQFYVLDKNMKPVPIGIAGELYIGGDGVAKGYINREKLTNERFIKNIFSSNPESMMYKTGDLVRYNDDGNLEYLGRIDFQVKIRGYRIELEDIETAISKHTQIKQAVCKIIQITESDKRIVAYIRPGENYIESDLRSYLREILPDYMIPNYFYILEQFPLTPNGKIDRKALPQVDFKNLEKSDNYVHPETKMQKEIVKIWEQVLNRERIGINDNFFDLGGHSLLAAKLIHQLNQKLGIEFTLRDLFSDPTVAGLARTIKTDQNDQIPLLFQAQPKGDKTPLFLVAGVYDQFYYKLDTTKSMYEDDFLRYFNNLIVYLGTDRPVYGLRPRGIFLNEQFHSDVKSMAKEYIREIKKIQPTGPYLIGGECLGGIVAYEIAQQLLTQGDEVALCILMDTYKPDILFEINYRMISNRQKAAKIIRNNLKKLKDEKVRYIKNILLNLPGIFKFYRKLLLPLTREEIKLRRVHFGSKIYAGKLIKYRPKLYKGEIALIINEEWNSHDPNLGWTTQYCQNITMKVIPGNHTTRLTHFGKICGTVLKDCIEKALTNYY